MDNTTWLSVTLYMQKQFMTGFIRNPFKQRLLDLLNVILVRKDEQRGRFLELSEVTMYHADGKSERLSTAYVNRATIQLVTTSDVELSRGIGSKLGSRPYPFQDKVAVPIKLSTPAYEVVGNMHRISHQITWQVLEDRPIFLPVTDAEIRALTNDACVKVAFVAVNKEHILFLQQTSLAQGSPDSLNLVNELLIEPSFVK
jgi:hypothetical protein